MDMPQTYHFFDLTTVIAIISILFAIVSSVVFVWFNRDPSPDSNTDAPKGLYISDNLKMLDQAMDKEQVKLGKIKQRLAQKPSTQASDDHTGA